MRVDLRFERAFSADGVTIHYCALADVQEAIERCPEILGLATGLPIKGGEVDERSAAFSERLRLIAIEQVSDIDGVEDQDGQAIDWSGLTVPVQRRVMAQLGGIAQGYYQAFLEAVAPSRRDFSD